MKEITFEINSNEELWIVIDKSYNHILIHKFRPHSAIEWWKTDIKMNNNEIYNGLTVRNMEFDILTDLDELKKIISLNSRQLLIYQFDKPVPNTLSIEYLPQNNREKILMKNGLKQIYFCDFEFLTISSYSEKFIKDIEYNEIFKERIEERKNKINQS